MRMNGLLRLVGTVVRAGLVVVVVGGSACADVTTFTVPAESSVEVPGAPLVGANPLLPEQVFPGELLGRAMSDALQQSFDTQGYDKDAVASLKLTSLALEVVDAVENDREVRGLGFLESLALSVAAEGFTPVLAAESEAGAFDGTPGPARYAVPTTDAELKELFAGADALELAPDIVPSDPPNFNTTVTVRSELTVVVDVFGALN
jgi:hypothetical protein